MGEKAESQQSSAPGHLLQGFFVSNGKHDYSHNSLDIIKSFSSCFHMHLSSSVIFLLLNHENVLISQQTEGQFFKQ